MKNLVFGICSLLMYMSVYAQSNFLPFSVDYATFNGNDNKTFTEIYVSFYQSELTYQVEDTFQVAHFAHSLKISQGDSIIQTAVRRYKNSLPLGANTKILKQFMDVFAFEFEPGTYSLQIITLDDVAQKNGAYNLKLQIPSYGSKLLNSDIQLSSNIERTKNPSNFSIKNQMEIIPNPSRIFGIWQPLLYFYFEVYNLQTDNNGQNSYRYKYFIKDAEGNKVRDFPEKVKSTSSTIIAETGGTNVITLSTNDYVLAVEFEDLISKETLTIEKEFRIERPTKKSTQPVVATDIIGYEEYLNYTEEELVKEFEKLSYIALEQEEDIFAGLDKEGRQKFLAEFWQRRDPDKSTPINEYKREFFENLQYADQHFSSAFSEGWKTDRGRVLLIYGKPSEIERYPSTSDRSPYEIWQYYALEGGSYFVFADLSGHGTYELLHSDYRNEIYDPDWEQRLSGSGFR